MKITAVKTFPYDGVFRDLVFVKVETDEGIYGWGEAGGMGRERACEATVQEIKHYFIGQDPGQIELLWNTVYRDAYRRPDDTLLNALAGVEIALWDILGKSLNVPIYKLLGGACHPRIKVYGNTWFVAQPPDSKLRRLDYYSTLAADTVASGFEYLKFDPWRDTGSDLFVPRKDARQIKETVRAIRQGAGDEVELLIEVHGRLSPEDAIQAARDLEEFRPYWIEEPIPPRSQCGRTGQGEKRDQDSRRRRRTLHHQVAMGGSPAKGSGGDRPAGPHSLRRHPGDEENRRHDAVDLHGLCTAYRARPLHGRRQRARRCLHAELPDPGILHARYPAL